MSQDTISVPPTLHHINLKTTRLQEMIEWYSIVLDMKSTFQFPGGAWLTNDGANHRIALLTSPHLSEDSDKQKHTGMHHCAFEYATMGSLLDTYARLKVLGIEPHASLDHGMTMSFYYEDPDDNSVELQSDNFGDWQVSSEWMRTSPQFAANPIGMPVDPAQMVAARQTGASFTELHQRAYAGEFQPSSPLDLHVPL
ncbi:MAG: VOC family protein [Ktedonobacteraceae bacterium]|nr:VOC family protein [Ktedonobacteraceae bacterium]